MASLRRLERLLWIVLVWMGLSMVWVGRSLEDPNNDYSDGRRAWLVASMASRNRTVVAPIDPKPLSKQQSPLAPPSEHSSSSASSSGSNLWTSNPVIPGWMKEYMDWHSSVVGTLNVGNWEQYKYLILRCHRKDEKCGGVSDRLKPVPLMVLAAQRSKRILFIDWDRPCPLSEFLVSPPGGFPWSAPPFLLPILQTHPSLVLSRASNLIEYCQTNKAILVQAHVHDTQGGMTQYDTENGQGSFQEVYHDLFRIFFMPSPRVQRLIDLHLKVQKKQNNAATTQLQQSTDDTTKSSSSSSSSLLVEGEYSVAHFRAEYGREISRHPRLSDPTFLRKVAINAIRCASELQPPELQRVPIYFASDNPLALDTARELATTFQYPIITFHRSENTPLKLDDYPGSNTTTTNNGTTPTNANNGDVPDIRPSDYYSTFVDLYVAGSGKCVTHGRGGFGRFASLLSYNASCVSRHVKQFFPVLCQGRPPFQGEIN
jgi:hypothetical protein